MKIIIPHKKLPHEYLAKLDDEMLDILKSKNYPADIKQKLYNQVLHTYNVTRDKMQQPLEVEMQNFPQKMKSATENKFEFNILVI